MTRCHPATPPMVDTDLARFATVSGPLANAELLAGKRGSAARTSASVRRPALGARVSKVHERAVLPEHELPEGAVAARARQPRGEVPGLPLARGRYHLRVEQVDAAP